MSNDATIEERQEIEEVQKTEAQAKAEAQLIESKAEAEANKKLSIPITDELIRMKEAEARLKHGWVAISGSDTNTVVTDK